MSKEASRSAADSLKSMAIAERKEKKAKLKKQQKMAKEKLKQQNSKVNSGFEIDLDSLLADEGTNRTFHSASHSGAITGKVREMDDMSDFDNENGKPPKKKPRLRLDGEIDKRTTQATAEKIVKFLIELCCVLFCFVFISFVCWRLRWFTDIANHILLLFFVISVSLL